MECPECGYILTPLDKQCPRCVYLAKKIQDQASKTGNTPASGTQPAPTTPAALQQLLPTTPVSISTSKSSTGIVIALLIIAAIILIPFLTVSGQQYAINERQSVAIEEEITKEEGMILAFDGEKGLKEMRKGWESAPRKAYLENIKAFNTVNGRHYLPRF